MNQVEKLLTSLVVAVFLALPVTGVSIAQNDTTDESTTTTETDEVESDTPSSTDRAADREARKLERQQKFADIDEAKAQRVAGRCNGAQQKLANALSRAETVNTNRTSKYDNVSSKLDKLVERLEAADVDTATLKSQINDLDSLVSDFFVVLDEYIAALADASEIDCEEDTEGFLLALEDARALVVELKSKSKEISTQVKDVIVSTLMDIKDSLKPSDGDEAADDNDSSEENDDQSDEV